MKKEIKIALAAIAALVILFFGLNFLKGVSVFSSNDLYYITFQNVSGVGKNCAIEADGVVVGSVSDITYDYTHKEPTRLAVLISKDMRIPAGSKAEIKSDLMGNTHINLLLATNLRERVNPGETIEGIEAEETMEKLKAMLPTVEAMLPKLDSILGSINALLADPAIRQIVHNAESATANLDHTSAELNKLMAQLNKNVPGMLTKADNVLANTEVLTGKLAGVDVEGTMNKVNSTLSEVETTMKKINSTDGTIGKLINDPALYDNLNATMHDADQLMIDFKAHPKRYIHFSVFGKKDK